MKTLTCIIQAGKNCAFQSDSSVQDNSQSERKAVFYVPHPSFITGGTKLFFSFREDGRAAFYFYKEYFINSIFFCAAGKGNVVNRLAYEMCVPGITGKVRQEGCKLLSELAAQNGTASFYSISPLFFKGTAAPEFLKNSSCKKSSGYADCGNDIYILS